MPFTCSDDYKAALATGTTFQSYALRIVRLDGAVFSFTRLRQSISLPELVITLRNGVSTMTVPAATYSAQGALRVSNLEQTDDITAADNMEATLTIGAWLPLADVLKGLFEGASFTLLFFDWKTPAPAGHAPRIMLRLRGQLGDRSRNGNEVTWKLRSLANRLKNQLLDITTPLSRSRWGDPELAFFDLAGNTHDGFAARVVDDIDSVDGTYPSRVFTITSTIGFPTDRFTNGLVTFRTGPNAGATRLVLNWDSPTGVFQLDQDTPFPITAGDQVQAQIAWPLTKEQWTAYFGDLSKFPGEIDIPPVENVNKLAQ